jgi:hypothetical protein
MLKFTLDVPRPWLAVSFERLDRLQQKFEPPHPQLVRGPRFRFLPLPPLRQAAAIELHGCE